MYMYITWIIVCGMTCDNQYDMNNVHTCQVLVNVHMIVHVHCTESADVY